MHALMLAWHGEPAFMDTFPESAVTDGIADVAARDLERCVLAIVCCFAYGTRTLDAGTVLKRNLDLFVEHSQVPVG